MSSIYDIIYYKYYYALKRRINVYKYHKLTFGKKANM